MYNFFILDLVVHKSNNWALQGYTSLMKLVDYVACTEEIKTA